MNGMMDQATSQDRMQIAAEATDLNSATAGTLAAAHGVVLDVDFPEAQLPPIRHALQVRRPPLPPLTVEVQSHVTPSTVRCLSLGVPTGSVVGWSSQIRVDR